MKKQGENPNNYKLLDYKDEIYNLYWNQKKSQAQIAKRLGVTQSAIGYFMKKHSIKARSRSEAESGKFNPFYGRKHSEKTKKKIGEKNKIHMIGSNNPNWKGGIRKRPDGYLRTSKDEYVHRLVMEKYLGRKLKPDEIIHHKDGNPSNNNIDNLELTTNSKHRIYHTQSQQRNKRGVFL